MPKVMRSKWAAPSLIPLRNSQFTVRLDNGHELLAYTGGETGRFGMLS